MTIDKSRFPGKKQVWMGTFVTFKEEVALEILALSRKINYLFWGYIVLVLTIIGIVVLK